MIRWVLHNMPIARTIMIPLTLTCAVGARAHTYEGPRTPIMGCAGKASCNVSGKLFSAIRLQGLWNSDATHTLISYKPVHPVARGDAKLTLLTLEIERRIDTKILLVAVRHYETIAGGEFTVRYPVTDPIALVDPRSSNVRIDLTAYVSQNQIWIESVQGQGPLAPVWTVPLFFGTGPNTGDVTISIDSNHGWAGSVGTSFYEVEEAPLIDDLNVHYAALPQNTPFLFRGDRTSAAALASAMRGNDE